MEAWEIEVFHFVKVNHAFLDLLVPAEPSLLLFLQFLQCLCALNWIIFPIKANEVTVERNGLSKNRFTMISFGVSLAFE